MENEILECKERMRRALNDAIRVCYNAEDDNSYPYACGYAKQTMRTVLNELDYLENLYAYEDRSSGCVKSL